MSEITRPRAGSMRLPSPVLVLVLVTMLWGGTFLVTRIALHFVGPFGFVGLRFAVAAIAVALAVRPHPASFQRRELVGGVVIGVILFLGYGLQADGLRTVASGESAFLTALYVPMVPMLEFLLFRRKPGLAALVGLILAFAGLVLISGVTPSNLALGAGAILTLGGALAAAVEIVLIGRFSTHTDPRRIALVQLTTVAVLALATELVRGGRILTTAPFAIGAVLGLGLVTAFIMVAQNWAQRSVPANRATLIYAMEPVWAGLIGAAFGEMFAAAQVFGGAMIVGSVVLSQWRSAR
ncbi:DMT family transporter [Acidiphilium iwatense]|uniref:DMT family transporter n=1 Tax=Acidiphilium iwatense TaxID=768198 RepID=A0ABS9DRJ6_9PROT|nr:DMT family transporter [Acidiphilium iwatense]MCF3945364.1 DMT family transporter [Acidiphilium iwatense]